MVSPGFAFNNWLQSSKFKEAKKNPKKLDLRKTDLRPRSDKAFHGVKTSVKMWLRLTNANKYREKCKKSKFSSENSSNQG